MAFDKTVLQVIPALDAGGAERTTVEIAAAVVEAGGRALVATRGGRLADAVEAAGGEVVRMPVHSKNPLVMAANRGRLLRLIRAEKVDIVHARSRAPAWSALAAARAAGVKFVATYHGAYEAGSALKRFYNSAMVRGDLVIANSGYTAEAIGRLYAVPAERLAVVPRGVDLSEFDPETIQGARLEAISRDWGGTNALRLLLPARLTPWKGHEIAVDALARLAAGSAGSGQRGDLKLIFAGDAQGREDYVRALRRAVERRGVREMIEIVGHCADMPAAYAWADVVLCPSTRPEAFGRVAVEAAAMACPAIAADHGGARETVAHEETGLLTPPGDGEALAAAIGRLEAAGAEGRARMGAAARVRAGRLFSLEAMRRGTLEAYRSLG